ncbi:hypothetical protein TNCV_4007601 [Trichonephila clavipes]|nr:hypothetical protein TNCV_4007601 [Trichonephila clavipes]
MFEKVSVVSDCPTVSSEEFVAVNDCNVGTHSPSYARQKHFGLWSKQNIMDADSFDENEMNMQLLLPGHPK